MAFRSPLSLKVDLTPIDAAHPLLCTPYVSGPPSPLLWARAFGCVGLCALMIIGSLTPDSSLHPELSGGNVVELVEVIDGLFTFENY